MPIYNQEAKTGEDFSTRDRAAEYFFEERVGLVAQALNDIRYENGVKYMYSEEGEELDTALRELQEYVSENDDEQLQAYVDRVIEADAEFDDIKYNGESESGPGAFVVLVDGPLEEYRKTVKELDGTAWGQQGRDPSLEDEDLAQLIYDTLGNHTNDGAIVIGEDEDGNEAFLPRTAIIPGARVSRNAYPAGGGTKHEAAVNAVYDDVRDGDGDEMVRASVTLSSTDGKIREFRRGDFLGGVAYETLQPLFDDEDPVDVTTLEFFEETVEEDQEEVRLYRHDPTKSERRKQDYLLADEIYPVDDVDGDNLVLRETRDGGIELWEQDVITYEYSPDDNSLATA